MKLYLGVFQFIVGGTIPLKQKGGRSLSVFVASFENFARHAARRTTRQHATRQIITTITITPQIVYRNTMHKN
jgi:exopolysaccharide biosynthesis predicted pyruvyltransferase EpsI